MTPSRSAVHRHPPALATSGVTRRRAAALLLAAAVVVSVPTTTLAASAPGDRTTTAAAARVAAQAVTWSIDHGTRTITATVRLQLGSSCTRGQMVRATLQGPAAAARCKVSQEIADAIRRNVDEVWNRDLKYRCYTLKVVTDITIAEALEGGVEQSEKAPRDRVHVSIDQTAANVRSMVNAAANTGNWASDDPADAVVPANGGDSPSTWKYPMTWETSLYAHEVGHVLGLSDQYEVFVGADGKQYSRGQAGAPADVMTSVQSKDVASDTIVHLARRAGFGDFALRCDYTVDRDTPLGKIRGTKCGGIDGDWVIRTDMVNGPATVKQTFTITVRSDRDVDSFVYEDKGTSKTIGGSTTSKADAKGTAEIRFNDDGSVTWTLRETEHTQSGTAKVNGRTFKQPKTKAPLVDWTWDWKSTVCAAP